MSAAGSPVPPDTKDWTWVLDQPCPECGFVASEVERAAVGEALRANAAGFALALRAPGVTERPTPGTWSVTEYACHVRDVNRVFDERVRAMLDEDAPVFANWDQDETAVAEHYDLQDPAVVGPALLAAADQVAATYDAVPADAWERRGLRSNGSRFTVDSIARYHVHDVVHHLWDVRSSVTVAAYDAAATAYRDQTQAMPASVAEAVQEFVAAVPPGARVQEIGSGADQTPGLRGETWLTLRARRR